MRTWVMVGCLLGVVVISALVFAPPKAEPPVELDPADYGGPIVVEPETPEPAVLAQVVDVTDIDPLLDPPALPIAEPSPVVPTLRAGGYEVPAPAPPPAAPAAPVVPIPPAAEDEGEGVEELNLFDASNIHRTASRAQA